MTQMPSQTSREPTGVVPTNEALERFRDLFNQMSSSSLGELGSVYSSDVEFADPFTRVSGLNELGDYFESAYANVIDCRFEFEDTIFGESTGSGQDACLSWTMHLRHKKLRKGARVTVNGISRLHLEDGKVTLHRDYFDAGQLLYENLPLLGSAVRMIRRYAA